MANRQDPAGKGWFAVDGLQTGDRTLDEQLTGLRALIADHVDGSSILDLGCAEGLISLRMMQAGAELVHGIESVSSRVDNARRFFSGMNAQFFVADLEDFPSRPPEGIKLRYDIVLALSIVQKLKDPAGFLRACAARSRGIVAIRLPEPVIKDRRSMNVPVDVASIMNGLGFDVEYTAPGPRGEWVGVFRRI